MSRRTFKYRFYPNRRQREKLQATLDVCRELYNAALQERREAWSSHRKGINYVEQASAGRRFASVDARGTSQRCPCGEPNPKRLWDREHVCLHCGLLTTRDHASAMEVLRLGLSLQPLTAV